MRKLIVSMAAVLLVSTILLFGGRQGTAHASEWWCWDDPVLVINGQVVHVLVGVPGNALSGVTTGEVIVTVPEGVDVKLTASAASRFPLTATLNRSGRVGADGRVIVTATATVHGKGSFDAGLRLVQPSGQAVTTYGQSNQSITAVLTLPEKTNPAAEARK